MGATDPAPGRVELVRRPALVVAGEPAVGAFGELGELVPAAWRRLLARSDLPAPAGGRYAEASAGLGGGRYLEVVGVLLEAAADVPDECALALLPAGRWARLLFEGPVSRIGDGFGEVLAWGERNGLALGGRKLDVGYAADGREGPHELSVQVLGAG